MEAGIIFLSKKLYQGGYICSHYLPQGVDRDSIQFQQELEKIIEKTGLPNGAYSLNTVDETSRMALLLKMASWRKEIRMSVKKELVILVWNGKLDYLVYFV